MARYGGSWRIPTAATARSASMVSELQSAAATTAHGGDLEEFTRSRVRTGSGFQWSSDLRIMGGDGCNFFKNQEFERQLDGISDQRSFLEDPGSSIFSLKNQWSFLEDAAQFSLTNSGTLSSVNTRDDQIQEDGSRKQNMVSSYNSYKKSPNISLHGHQVFDKLQKRLDYDDDEEARVQATKELLKCIIDQRICVKSVESCVRDEVLHNCNQTEQWLMKKSQQQDSLSRRAEPVLWSYEIRKQTTSLDTACKSLMEAVTVDDADDNDEQDAPLTAYTKDDVENEDEGEEPDSGKLVVALDGDTCVDQREEIVFEEGVRRNVKEKEHGDSDSEDMTLIDSEDEDEAVFFETSSTAITEVAHHYGAKQDKLIAVSPTEPTVILSKTELPNNPPTPRCVSTTSVSFECLRGCELGEPKPSILKCLYCWKEDNSGVENSEGVEGPVCHAGGITQGRSEESVICTSGSSVKEKNALVFDLCGGIHDVPFCNSLSQCQTRVYGTTLVDDEQESFGVEMNGQRCSPGQIGAQVLIAMNEPAVEKDVCELVKISGSSSYVLFPAQFSDGLQTENSKSKQTRKYNFLALALGIKELSSYINRRKFNNSPKYLKTMREVVELELRELLLADEEGGQTFDPGGGVAIVEAQLDNIVASYILRLIEWIEEVVSDTQAAAIITSSVFHIMCLMFVRKLHSSISALQNWKFLLKRAEILGFSITINTFFIRSEFGIALNKKSLQNFLFCIDEVSLEADLIREAIFSSILSIPGQCQYVLLLIPGAQVVKLDSDMDYERSLKQLVRPVKGAARKLPRPVTAEPRKIDNGVYGPGKSTWHQPLPYKDHAQIIGTSKHPVKVTKDDEENVLVFDPGGIVFSLANKIEKSAKVLETAYVHLSSCVPALKDMLKSTNEHLGADSIQKVLEALASLITNNSESRLKLDENKGAMLRESFSAIHCVDGALNDKKLAEEPNLDQFLVKHVPRLEKGVQTVCGNANELISIWVFDSGDNIYTMILEHKLSSMGAHIKFLSQCQHDFYLIPRHLVREGQSEKKMVYTPLQMLYECESSLEWDPVNVLQGMLGVKSHLWVETYLHQDEIWGDRVGKLRAVHKFEKKPSFNYIKTAEMQLLRLPPKPPPVVTVPQSVYEKLGDSVSEETCEKIDHAVLLIELLVTHESGNAASVLKASNEILGC